MSVETVGLDQLRAHVRVSGDLDMATGAPLWAVLECHLAAGRRFVRLDVSDVEFVDAAALAGISEAHYAALAQRGTLVLTGVRPALARLLRLTGLDEVLFVSGPRGSDVDFPAERRPEAESAATVWPSRRVPSRPPPAI